MTTVETKDGITSIKVDDGRINLTLDFQRFFAMTDDRDPNQKEGSNESAKKQKKLLKFFSEWNVDYDDIDDLFDEAIEAIPLSERLKENQKEWFRVTKRAKPEDKMATRLVKMEYCTLHEDALVASDTERSIVVEYYPQLIPEFTDHDDDDKLAKLHDRILDSSWKTVGTMTKSELAIEIESSDTRFMNIFGQKVNRKTVKRCQKYIKEKADFQIDDSSLVAMQVTGDLTLYIGRVME